MKAAKRTDWSLTAYHRHAIRIYLTRRCLEQIRVSYNESFSERKALKCTWDKVTGGSKNEGLEAWQAPDHYEAGIVEGIDWLENQLQNYGDLRC